MARVTLRITGTQLLCQDGHPSLLAALESHNVAVEYQCAKVTAVPVARALLQARWTGLPNR